MFLATMAFAAMVNTVDPDLVYMNTKYAVAQAEEGLMCYGCGDKPMLIKGTEEIKYSDHPLVEAGSAGVVFISTGVSEQCAAGKQYAINLASAKAWKLETPCDATDFQWTFSEGGVVYSYTYKGETHDNIWAYTE